MYNSFNFITAYIVYISEYNLATLDGLNTFFLKIIRVQIGYKKGVMGANSFHGVLDMDLDLYQSAK
jgi:hypothetical protein